MTGGRIQQVINAEMQVGGSMYENGLEMVWSDPVHPCFLYESIWCLLGFALLAFWSKRRRYDGQLLLMYMAWYGLERAVVEGLRTDSLMIGSIRVSQALSIVIFIASVLLQIIIGFKVKRDPESFVLYASTEESRMLIEETRRKSMKAMGVPEDDDDDEIGILDDEDDDDNSDDEGTDDNSDDSDDSDDSDSDSDDD
jgi:phosphatidylglycerol:prolipoprotein diacylglycerol transferase